MAVSTFIITILLVILYLTPTMVAASQKKANMNAIAVLNILLGWTGVGWVIALIWACTKDKNHHE